MKIGFVGLGKLGLPTAVTQAMRGHDVMGYDVDDNRMSKEPQGYVEAGPDGTGDFNKYLADSDIHFGSLDAVVAHGDIVFVAVQTPHDPLYEGVTPMPEQRADFNYEYLVRSIKEIVNVCDTTTILAVISTVLPGTMAREVMPVLKQNPNLTLVYTPGFTANGTVMRDYLHQEFWLVGSKSTAARDAMEEFYRSIADAPVKKISIESAELAKVIYNTFITLKIDYANTIMELCEKIPSADAGEICDVLKTATTRVISPAYMTPGMGDGGVCHPRDNIAMSWLAQKVRLSYDIFEALMTCREQQAQWLAYYVCNLAKLHDLPIVFLGQAFKAESNITGGSPAILTAHYVEQLGYKVTYADDNVVTTVSETEAVAKRAVFLISCKHARYQELHFKRGSIVVDPHRYIPKHRNYKVFRLGERS